MNLVMFLQMISTFVENVYLLPEVGQLITASSLVPDCCQKFIPLIQS